MFYLLIETHFNGLLILLGYPQPFIVLLNWYQYNDFIMQNIQCLSFLFSFTDLNSFQYLCTDLVQIQSFYL